MDVTLTQGLNFPAEERLFTTTFKDLDQAALPPGDIRFAAPPPPEICDDGIDNDGDGLIDCADPDCMFPPTCNVIGYWIIGPYNGLTAQIVDNVPSAMPLCLGSISSPGNLIDCDTANYTAINITGIGCDGTLSVTDTTSDYPSGTYAGFEVSSTGLISGSVASSVTISTYLNGAFQESQTLVDALTGVNSSIIGPDGRVRLGFITTFAWDEIRIEYTALVGVLFTAQIYAPVIGEFCAGPPPVCNTLNAVQTPTFPVVIDQELSGFDGLTCVGCWIADIENVINPDSLDFAEIGLTAVVGASAGIAVKNVLDTFLPDTYAGFEISSLTLADAELIEAITIRTYRNGVVQDSLTNTLLLGANSFLLNDSSHMMVGLVATKVFDEIEIEVFNLAGVLNTINIYRAVIKPLCPGPNLECNKTYLTEDEFPVVINSELTGVEGLVCGGCSVDHPNRIIDTIPDNFAEIHITAGVAADAGISVLDPTTVYVAGTIVCIDVENFTIIDLDLLSALKVETYLNGSMQEYSPANFLSLELFTASRGSLCYETSLPFNEVRFVETGLLGVDLGVTRLYGFSLTGGDEIYGCCPSLPPSTLVSDTIVPCATYSLNLNNLIDPEHWDVLADTLIWYDNPMAVGDSLTNADNITSGGTYYAFYYNNYNQCTGPASMAVNVHLPGQFAVSTTDTLVCAHTAVTLSINNPPGIQNIAWSPNTGDSTNSSVTLMPVTPQWYSVAITDTLSCVTYDSVYVDVFDTMVVTVVSQDTTLCPGDASILTANVSQGDGPFTYMWSSGPTTDSITVSPGLTTTFTVEVSDIHGCLDSAALDIIVLTPPLASLTDSTVICAGDTVSLTTAVSFGLAPYSALWSHGDTLLTSVVVPDSSADFFITVTDAEGCKDTASAYIAVLPRPVTAVSGDSMLCIGNHTQLAPASGGSWATVNPAVAGITTTGWVTGVGAGTAAFIFTDASTGCLSDTMKQVTITTRPTITIDFNGSICLTDTSTLSAVVMGGTEPFSYNWTGPNGYTANGATVNINANGNYYVTVTDALGCSDNISGFVYQQYDPFVFTLNTTICEGESVTLQVNSGSAIGYQWGPNAGNATTSSVVVFPLPPSETYRVTVTNDLGCTSTAEATIDVDPKPIVSVDGPSTICNGDNTQLNPSTGGSWVSLNSAVATVTPDGWVTALNPGTATFVFTDAITNCSSSPGLPVYVAPIPVVTITGPAGICTGSTTTLAPTSGGTWSSDNPSVASVANNGIATAVSPGIVKFTFTSNAGCVSQKTSAVSVFSRPTVLLADSSLCVGGQINIMPSSGGTWASTNNSIATVTNSGLVTGIAQGIVQFIFTENSLGCTSEPSVDIPVYPRPVVALTGPNAICVGATTQLSPTSGGVWYSNDPGIASVDNSGMVVGVSGGVTTFYFVNNSTNCVSNNSPPVTIIAKPQPVFSGPDAVCIGQTTTILPDSGGVWSSQNPGIATINNAGTITALAQGEARFRFTQTATGCQSDLSPPLTVNGPPAVGLLGPPTVCEGSTTLVYPSSGGTWMSTDSLVIAVANNGTVTGISAGSAFLIFTDAQTGCSSDGSLSIDVYDPPVVTLDGDSTICIGFSSYVSSAQSGVWVSSDDRIATVSSTGVVKGVVPGKASIRLIDPATGCLSDSSSAWIDVVKCFNPDFNVSLQDLTITGNLSTNDIVPVSASYSSLFEVMEQPAGSSPFLSINSDGSYSFVSSVEGKYLYQVKVCEAPLVNGCPENSLEITVLGNIYSENYTVNNPEFITTFAHQIDTLPGENTSLPLVANDRCVYTLGCGLDTAQAVIMAGSKVGAGVLNTSGQISYTPDAGVIGYDTITYKICNTDTASCSESRLYLTINHPTAANSVVAPDDFAYTMAGIAITGNVKDNDSDPEGDQISVQVQGSPGNEIIIAEGAYFIQSDGTFQFTPAPGFEGAAEIIYQLCDDHLDTACMNATLHLLVFGEMSLSLRVYMEGALMENGDLFSGSGRPLMRDDLRSNPFDGSNAIPTSDPYSGQVGFIDLSTKYDHSGPGLLASNKIISDSAAVFGTLGEDAIVDWVFIELRDKNDMFQTFATRSALVQRDGDVVDLDGISPVRFNGIGVDSFFVVIKHRSHLAAMTMLVGNNQLIDFTDPNLLLFDFGFDEVSGVNYTGLSMNTNIKQGYRALWAGDFDSNGKIKYTNPTDDTNFLFFEVIAHEDNSTGSANFDSAYGYTQGDFNMNGKAKYTNPNDDTNMLYTQVLFYPENTVFYSNFNYFIEQVPRLVYGY